MISLRNLIITSIFFIEDLARIIAVDLGNRILDIFSYLGESRSIGKTFQRTGLLKGIEESIEEKVNHILTRQTMSDRRKIFFGSDPFKS
jgi:hypothetical protein